METKNPKKRTPKPALPFSSAEQKFIYENNKKEMPFGISFLFILLKYIELENDWCYNYL